MMGSLRTVTAWIRLTALLCLVPALCPAASVRFLLPSGFYASPQTLVLEADPPDSEIRVTFDGSLPTAGTADSPANGVIYLAPLDLQGSRVIRARAFTKSGEASAVATHSYLFAGSLLSQPAQPPGFPAFWAGTKADYAMDPRVVNDPRHADIFLHSLRQLPWMSLVMAPGDLFGTNGIYANSLLNGSNWERSVSCEFFESGSTNLGFQIDAGLQITGDSSRGPEVVKHSLRLSFKSKFGPSKLHYPFFQNSSITEFDTLTLLGGSVDAVPQNFIGSDLATPLHLRDAFLKDSQLDSGRPGVHTRYAHLFLNGLYWGLYRVSERPDAGYASAYFGGRKSDYDVLKHLDFAQLEVVDGDRVAWDDMVRLATQGLQDPARYSAIQAYLDVEAFIDYLIVNMHLGNGDWPQKNWYAFRKRATGEPFRFFCWDGDVVLGLVGITLNKTGFATPNTPAFLYSKLRENAEFRMRFGDRIQALVMNDGPLSVAACQARLQRVAGTMQSGILGESARWGDAYVGHPGRDLFTFEDHWLPELARVAESVIPSRHLISLEHFRVAGLAPRIGPVDLDPPSGVLGADNTIRLSHTNEAGTIYFTLDGADPRLPGDSISASATLYSGPIPIPGPASLNARVKTDAGWSALITRRLLPGPGPVILEVVVGPGQVRLRFQARTGFKYEVQACDALPTRAWKTLHIFPEQASDGVLEVLDPDPPGASGTRFYQVLGL